MKGFDFSDVVVFEIAGHTFRTRMNDETKRQVEEMVTASQALTAAIESGEKSEEEAIRFCGDVINRILGEGAAKTIFAGRTPTILDACAVIQYMTTVLRAHQFKVLLPQITDEQFARANREVRRAASRKRGKKK